MATDDMEKKHAYRLEQARQRLSDEHEKVRLLLPLHLLLFRFGALQRKKIKKSEFTREPVSLGIFCVENHPKLALNQY